MIFVIYFSIYYLLLLEVFMQRKFVLSFFTALILTTQAHADEGLETLFAMSLDELLQVEITSATYSKEDIYSVPSSITIFTYDQIHKMSVNSLEELMNYVPGFQSARNNVYTNQSTAHTRGRFSSAFKDVLVVFDGQRLNTDWSGGAMLANRLISLDNVEKIEFIKGPGSALYGSNAFMGVISITTKKDLNNVGTRFGTGYIDGYLNYSYNEDGLKLSGFAKGLYDSGQEYESQLDRYTNTYRDPKDKNSGSEFYLNAKYNSFTFQMRHQRRDTEGWYTLGRNSDQSSSEVCQDFIRVGYIYDELSDFVSEFYLSYIYSEVKPTYAKSLGTISSIIIEDDSTDFQWKNAYTINDENRLNFGAEYRHPTINEASISTNGGARSDIASSGSRDIYGLYGQYQTSISDFEVTLGARYDDYSDFGSTFNPRAAVVYQPFDDTSFKLLYGSAYRAPTRNELDLLNNSNTVGNPNLKPETIETYEAIVIQRFGSSSLSLSYFDSHIKDAIVDVATGSLRTRENGGSQEFAGVEAELISEFLEQDLNTRFAIAHMTHTHQEIRTTPLTTLSAIVNYRYSDLNFNLNGFYHSSAENKIGSTITKLDDYMLFNTKMTYNVNSELKCYFELQNMFDESYKTPSSVGADRAELSNRGRLAYIGLEYSF